MTTGQSAPSATTLVGEVERLAPMITGRAGEIEAARRLPGDLLGTLAEAGCFRMLLPESHGGAGIGLPAMLRVVEALSRADGSVGWTVMIGAGSWCDLAGLPRATFDAIYAGGPDLIIGGAFAPAGTAVPAAGGYRIRGRWGFASGCEHCAWLYGNCVEEVGGQPRLRMAVFAPDEVEIQDTWRTSGLRGTGSHHFVADVVIPAERTYPVLEGRPCLDEPVLRISPPALYSTMIAGVAVGIAQGALDEIRAVAVDRRPLLSDGSLAANPWYQHQLATADTRLRAARALLHHDADTTWATATSGREFAPDQRARIRSTAVWVTSTAATVVDAAHHAGGGGTVYLDSPLQRRLRDIHAVTQHFLVRPDTLTTAGAVLSDQVTDLTIF